jgi:hypothetical protein
MAGAARPAAVVAAGAGAAVGGTRIFVVSDGFPGAVDESPRPPPTSIATTAMMVTPTTAAPMRQKRNRTRNRVEPFTDDLLPVLATARAATPLVDTGMEGGRCGVMKCSRV